MTYEEIYTEFIASLKVDLAHARSADIVEVFNPKVCIGDVRTYYIPTNTVECMQKTIKEYKDTTTLEGYISTKVTMEYDVNSWRNGDDIEAGSVTPYILVVQYKPMTDKEFTDLTSNKHIMQRMFKRYVGKGLHKSADVAHSYTRSIDCNMLELFKNNILDYNQLVKAVYTDCKL